MASSVETRNRLSERSAKWSKGVDVENDLGSDSWKVVEDQGEESKNFQKQKPHLGGLMLLGAEERAVVLKIDFRLILEAC